MRLNQLDTNAGLCMHVFISWNILKRVFLWQDTQKSMRNNAKTFSFDSMNLKT